jgi:predicted RNA-binding Zn ribbon-like protein
MLFQIALHLQAGELMKKALPGQKEVFVIERQGNVLVWDFFAEEIVEAANKGLGSGPANNSPENRVLNNLRQWMSRYLNEGVTDDLLNDLNAALHEIRYSKYIFPLDLMPSDIGFPQNGYVAKYDRTPSPKALAADDFSKLLTSGLLKRLKRCQLGGCEKLFLGPPQAKWCSKSCGSKFRVREKRRRESS